MVEFGGITIGDHIDTDYLLNLLSECQEYYARYGTASWREFIDAITTMIQLHCL